MEDLIGNINPNELVKDYKKQLDNSLSLFNADIQESNTDYLFFAGPRKDYMNLILEPCPIYYAGNLKKKSKIVFLGINPFFDDEAKLKNKEVRKFECDKVTWLDLAKFNCPSDENEISHSIYKHIVDNAFNGSKYHGYAFRMYLALMHNNMIFDKWSQVKEVAFKYAERKHSEVKKSKENDYLKEFFIEEHMKEPAIFAEMIPYKSRKYQGVNMERLLKSNEYKHYLAHLMDFIYENTTSDSILIFMGNQSNVIKFLDSTKGENKLLPSSFDKWDDCKKMIPGTKNKAPIYFINSTLQLLTK